MKVLYFANAREIAGTKVEEIDPDSLRAAKAAAHDGSGDGLGADAAAPMVSDLLSELGSRHGQTFAELVERSTVMVDDQVVARDLLSVTPVGSEVAILPPVSGGDGPVDAARHDHHVATADRQLAVAVLTISDRASVGTYDDRTGPALVDLIQQSLGARIVETRIVEDSRELIAATVSGWCDRGGPDREAIDLVVTNGGTGLSERDVTPEAIRAILDVEAPGLGEVMRAKGLSSTPLAALSRQLGGRRGRTVVVAVPGSVRAATESLEAVVDILAHLCELASQQTVVSR